MTTSTLINTNKSCDDFQVAAQSVEDHIGMAVGDMKNLKDIVAKLQESYSELQRQISETQQEHDNLQTDVEHLMDKKAELLAEISDFNGAQHSAGAAMDNYHDQPDDDDNMMISNDDDDDDSECTEVGNTQAVFEGFSSIGFGVMSPATEKAVISSLKQKRRVSKASRSPKKWRRMIKSHRLQSILLTE